MFTVTYKGFDVACETAQDAVEFIDTADKPSPGSRARITAPATTRATTRKPRKKTARTAPSRSEKDKRNAKARAAYRAKHPEKTTTTTSRLEALPSKPTATTKKPGGQKRARTSAAVEATMKRSGMPLTLEEIDTDLEKSGWPYKGPDRKGAIRATLNRMKAQGTVSVFMRADEQMYRLVRTNGEVSTPVEQAITTTEPPTEPEIMGAEALREKAPEDDRW